MDTNISKILSGLHETDKAITSKLSSAIASFGSLSSVGGETIPLINSLTGKMDSSYNPLAIASIEKPAGLNALDRVQFIGDCKVTYRADGSAIIRIGLNLNSSNYNTTDGQTNAYAILTAPEGTACELANGTSVILIKDNDPNIYASSVSGNALVHFPDLSATFELLVLNGISGVSIYTFGPITESNVYKGKNTDTLSTINDLTMTVSNFKAETLSAKGATGYCGNVSFDIPAAIIGENSNNTATSVKINKITCVNTLGTFDYVPAANTRWYLTDTSTLPVLSSVSFTLSKSGIKKESGVTYITGGKVSVSTTGLNFKTPAYLTNDCGSITAIDSTWFSTATIKKANLTSDTAMSYSGIGIAKGKFDNCDVKVKMKNINGNSSEISTSSDVKILQYDNLGSINEGMRLQSDIMNSWNSATPLSGIDNGNGLQVEFGIIKYPSTDYTGYNSTEGLDIAEQPDYSKESGSKTYFQKFIKSGTLKGGTVTLTSVASTDGICGQAAGFKVYVWNGISSNGWLNISKVGDGIATATTYGTTTSLTFSFTQESDYGNSALYVKIEYALRCAAQIKNITLA